MHHFLSDSCSESNTLNFFVKERVYQGDPLDSMDNYTYYTVQWLLTLHSNRLGVQLLQWMERFQDSECAVQILRFLDIRFGMMICQRSDIRFKLQISRFSMFSLKVF